jgi:hypothetical protein
MALFPQRKRHSYYVYVTCTPETVIFTGKELLVAEML